MYVMTYCLHNVIKKQRNVLHVIDYKFIVGIQWILFKTKCTVRVTSLADAVFIKKISSLIILYENVNHKALDIATLSRRMPLCEIHRETL